MQRYFVDELPLDGKVIVTGENFHHIAHVMRSRVGEKHFLVFPDHTSVVGELLELTADEAVYGHFIKEAFTRELPVTLTIACGLPKGDKLDWIVQKGTELGAAAFTAFPSQTSVVRWDEKKRSKRLTRLEKIAKEAAEQSHRTQTPLVRFTSFAELLQDFPRFTHVLIAYEESAKEGERAQLVQTFEKMQPGDSLLAVFGPEGGFAPEEIAQFEKAGAKCCGLGPRILRAETAPLYVLASASFYFELSRGD